MKKSIQLYILVVTLIVTTLASTTNIFATWTTPVKISNSSQNAVVSQVTADPSGYIHVVWDEINDNWDRPNNGIYYSRWNGDTWSAPAKISDNTTSFADNPAIASDSNGIIHVVYSDDKFGPSSWSSRIAYTKRATNGSWSTPVQLPSPSGNFDYSWNAKVSVDPSNNIFVSFFASMNEYQVASIYVTKSTDGGANWSTPELVSYSPTNAQVTDTQYSVIKSDKLGNTHIVYWSWGQGLMYRKLTGTTWSTPVSIDANNDIEFMDMTVDDSGNPYITWYRHGNVYVRRSISGAWQTTEQLSSTAILSAWGWPITGITTTSKGIIAVGWGEHGANDTVNVVYQYYNGSSWSAKETVVTDRVNANNPFIWRDIWDNQHLVWTELNAQGKWEQWYSAVQGTQQSVGSAGGTVTINPSNTTLATMTFPANALSTNTTISALVGPLPESVSSSVVTIPRAYTFGPVGQTFTTPISVAFKYTTAELAGGDPATLSIYVWDGQTSTWAGKTGSLNKGQKTVTVSLPHFSLYGVAARAVETKFVEPTTKRIQTNTKATLPVRFSLTYKDNGQSLDTSDVALKLNDITEPVTKFTNNLFQEELKLKDFNLKAGTYTLEVLRYDVPVGSLTIEIL